MVLSMTGFASRKFSLPEGNLRWDIKSVNQRYFEASIKLPDVFQELEYHLRDNLRSKITRGKIFCQLQYEDNKGGNSHLEINEGFLEKLIKSAEAVSSHLTNAAPISPIELLKWPEVVKGSQFDLVSILKPVMEGFSLLIEDFLQARAKEGAFLKGFIEQRLQSIMDILHKIRERMPNILAGYRHRIMERVQEMKVQIDTNRLEQEMVFIAQKIDVAEELDRLEVHVKTMKDLLKKGGVIGRHLDFLSQELNREANTLASKSIDALLTQETVELKVLIEQIREQVQNIE